MQFNKTSVAEMEMSFDDSFDEQKYHLLIT